ncbi:MAG TPA: hypothetical protein VKB93_17420 [Thermoanaerobaculia bacterium]|nr:hypothetical protein [Thermoanaerobaculia bacterium]
MLPKTLEIETDGRRTVYVLRPDLTATSRSSAWYEPQDGGEAVQATGSVWVRFRNGEDAAARATDFARAGYRIESIPGYALHAAFVRAKDVGTSLANLDGLRAIDGVQHVEPQLLRKRGSR